MCICTYVYIYIYINITHNIYTHTYSCTYICLYICHIYVYTSIYIYIYHLNVDTLLLTRKSKIGELVHILQSQLYRRLLQCVADRIAQQFARIRANCSSPKSASWCTFSKVSCTDVCCRGLQVE